MLKKRKLNLLRTATVIGFIAVVNLVSSHSVFGDGVCMQQQLGSNNGQPWMYAYYYCTPDQGSCYVQHPSTVGLSPWSDCGPNAKCVANGTSSAQCVTNPPAASPSTWVPQGGQRHPQR
jgi:hypothetical protein